MCRTKCISLVSYYKTGQLAMAVKIESPHLVNRYRGHSGIGGRFEMTSADDRHDSSTWTLPSAFPPKVKNNTSLVDDSPLSSDATFSAHPNTSVLSSVGANAMNACDLAARTQ